VRTDATLRVYSLLFPGKINCQFIVKKYLAATEYTIYT